MLGRRADRRALENALPLKSREVVDGGDRLPQKREVISDIWGKRCTTDGEKGGVSAN